MFYGLNTASWCGFSSIFFPWEDHGSSILNIPQTTLFTIDRPGDWEAVNWTENLRQDFKHYVRWGFKHGRIVRLPFSFGHIPYSMHRSQIAPCHLQWTKNLDEKTHRCSRRRFTGRWCRWTSQSNCQNNQHQRRFASSRRTFRWRSSERSKYQFFLRLSNNHHRAFRSCRLPSFRMIEPVRTSSSLSLLWIKPERTISPRPRCSIQPAGSSSCLSSRWTKPERTVSPRPRCSIEPAGEMKWANEGSRRSPKADHRAEWNCGEETGMHR